MSLEETRKKLLNKFKEEADIHLLTLQRRLVDLELDANNSEYLREVFRAAHTIKGSARLMNFLDVSSVAHEMENIFAEMRDGRLQLQPETNDLLFEAVDTINTMIEEALKGHKNVNLDVAGLNERLAAILKPAAARAAPPPTPASSIPETAPSIPAPVELPLELDMTRPADDRVMTEPAVTPAAATLRAVGTLNDNVIRVDVGKLDELMNITGELVLGKMEAEATLDQLRTLNDLVRQRQRMGGPVRNVLANSSNEPLDFSVAAWQEIRETLLQLNRVEEQIELLVKNTLRDYEEHTSQLVSRVDELENNVKSVRMLPLETIYQDFPVSVRSIARQVGKEVDFRQTGGEIELDKKILEGIKDPLIHIIRNAIGHGIERSEVRLGLGKPRLGQLSVSARQDGGYVSIHITDDGKGMDLNEIRQAAVKKNFISEARAHTLSDEDVLNLIYDPGFSTADIIDDISGRGVGMDIAKTNLERLGGQINVATQKGLGTTVTLRVPVTMATSRALLVRVRGILHAILAPSIETMFYLPPGEILSREGREVILYGNSLVPLVKLEDLLGTNKRAEHPIFGYQLYHSLRAGQGQNGLTNGAHSNGDNGNGYSGGNENSNHDAVTGDGFVGLTLADPKARQRVRELQEQNRQQKLGQIARERLPAVVVGSGDRRVCLLVEELVDETEIVVKSLNPLLARAQHVNSASILGNGQVVMILDIPNLISSARDYTRTGIRKQIDKQVANKRILVVDDSITTRELERSILEAQGYTVELADDGTVALEILNRDNRFDLVISDVEMPNMNGFELTARIKANPALRQLPVIIVSSLNNDEHKRRGIDAGAQAYITKGDFEQANLLNTIEYLTG